MECSAVVLNMKWPLSGAHGLKGWSSAGGTVLEDVRTLGIEATRKEVVHYEWDALWRTSRPFSSPSPGHYKVSPHAPTTCYLCLSSVSKQWLTGQNKLFLFQSRLYLVFCDSNGKKNRTGKKKKRTGTGHKALQSGTFRLPGVTTSDPTPLPEFPCLLAKATVH